MALGIPRHNTAPFPARPLADAEEKAIPSFKTAPARRATDLKDIYEQRAEFEKQHGKPDAAEFELKRLQTYYRVKGGLQELKVEGQPPASLSAEGPLRKVLTSIRGAATGKKYQRPSLSDAEARKRKLLKRFRADTGGARALDFEQFKKYFDYSGKEFATRLFKYLDRSNTGVVFDEEIVGVRAALEGTFDEKIAFLWSFISSDGESITRKELEVLIKASASEGRLSLSDKGAEGLSTAFFVKAGCADAPSMTEAQFKRALADNRELYVPLTLGKSSSDEMGMLQWWRRLPMVLAKACRIEDLRTFYFLVIVILAELAGFIVGFLQNDHGASFTALGWSYPVAKGSARSIQVLLIVFPFTVARTLITALKSTFLVSVLPLNEHLKVHGHLAGHFFFWGLAHSIGHFINGARVDKPSRYKTLLPPPPPPRGVLLNGQMTMAQPPMHGPPLPMPDPHWWGEETQVTGLLLFGIMIVGFAFVLFKHEYDKISGQRKGSKAFLAYRSVMSWLGSFEAFYFTHIFMAISMLALLIIHPVPYVHERLHKSTTWLYLLAGTTIYLLERVMRFVKQLLWRTRVLDVKLHPGKTANSNVVELRLQVPTWTSRGGPGFNYLAGQYAFINIPKISKAEWHPFSLTSAPADSYLSFHIQTAGDWTTKLYELSEKCLMSSTAIPSHTNGDTPGGKDLMDTCTLAEMDLISPSQKNFFSVRIDGPYGAPAQDFKKYKTVLLMGTNIGATPFASVLRQLLYEFNAAKCTNCQCANTELFGVRKVYFYWSTREQHFAAALQKTLEELKAADVSNFLDLNIHITSAKEGDFTTALPRFANEMQHQQHGKDAFTGLDQSVPCKFGRPDWTRVVSKVALENTYGGDVGVFACGRPEAVAALSEACVRYNAPDSSGLINTYDTRFKIYKEVF